MRVTHFYLHGLTTATHSYLQGENWSQAWLHFQEKQQVINLYLIIETNGLTFSQAEHNTLKKPKVLIKTWDFSTWTLTCLKPSKSSAKATGTRLCLKFLTFTFQSPQSQDLRPAALCSTCQKNRQGLCRGPRRHYSKIRRSCTNLLQMQPLSLHTLYQT